MKTHNFLCCVLFLGCSSSKYGGLTDEPGTCPSLDNAQGRWVEAGEPPESLRYQYFESADLDEVFYITKDVVALTAFNPETGAIRVSGEAPDSFDDPNVASDNGDHVLVLAGWVEKGSFVKSPYARVWNWSTETWTYYDYPDYLDPDGNYIPHWFDGEFIMWGGTRGTKDTVPINSGAALNPKTGEWRPLGSGQQPDVNGKTVVTSDGLFLWWYSEEQDNPAPWLYSKKDDSWRQIVSEGPSPRRTFITSAGDKIYISGGFVDNKDGDFREVWELDLKSEKWRQITTPPNALIEYGTLWVDGQLIWKPSTTCRGTYTYRPATDEWGAVVPIVDFYGGALDFYNVNGRFTTYGLYTGHGDPRDSVIRQLHFD